MILPARGLACNRAAISILAAVLLLVTGLQRVGGAAQAQAEPQTPQLDILLLIDQSSSMVTNDSAGMRFKGARVFVELMTQGDRVAVVRFANGGSIVGSGLTADKSEALGAIDSLSQEQIPQIGNYTDMRGGLQQALDLIKGRPPEESTRRVAVVLFTDGAPCPARVGQVSGPEARAAVVVEEKNEILRLADQEFKANGWIVYTLGLVSGQSTDPCEKPDEAFLGDTAARTGGEYHPATNGEEIIDGYVDILAAIYQLSKRDLAKTEESSVNFWAPPKAQNLFVISRGGDAKVTIVPPPECPLAEQSTASVDEWGILRQAAPCSGCWQVTSASPEVEIRSLVVALDFVISTDSPRDGQELDAGEIDVAAEVNWVHVGQVDGPVDEASLLNQVANSVFAVALRRPEGDIADRKPLAQTASGSSEFKGTLSLQEGEYDIQVEIVGVQCDGERGFTRVANPVAITIVPAPPTPPEICTDGVDNDGDGRVDCEDPDCEEECREICTDGVDNDGDGRVDCEDPDCEEECREICTDEVDNDRDGRVDCEDPDCEEECREICTDGVDNDRDGKLDCDDPDCQGDAGCKEICDDRVDNDRDAKVDCDDPDCDDDCGSCWPLPCLIPFIFLFFGAAGVGAVYLLYLRSLSAAVGGLDSDHLSGGHVDLDPFNKHHLVLGTGAKADVKLLLDTKLDAHQADLVGVREEGFPYTKIINRSPSVSMQIQERRSAHPNTKTEHVLRNGDTIMFAFSDRAERVTLVYKRAGEPPHIPIPRRRV